MCDRLALLCLLSPTIPAMRLFLYLVSVQVSKTDGQWCTDKCLTAGTLQEENGFVVFADFHGVSTPTQPISSYQHDVSK